MVRQKSRSKLLLSTVIFFNPKKRLRGKCDFHKVNKRSQQTQQHRYISTTSDLVSKFHSVFLKV